MFEDARRRGVFCALRAWGLRPNADLVEDLMQESWLYWREHTPVEEEEEKRPLRQREAWAFNAGRYATLKFLSRRARAWKSDQAALAAAEWGSPTPSAGLPSDVASELIAAFFAQRSKQGQRGAEAALKEVAILDMIIQGYSDEGIGLELGLAPSSIKRYRNQIRRRLEAFQAGERDRFPAWNAKKSDTTKARPEPPIRAERSARAKSEMLHLHPRRP